VSRILVTGSSGLIGRRLVAALRESGDRVVEYDVSRGPEDVRDLDNLSRAMDGCRGVIHLAARSRVIDGERDPDGCWSVNVRGTEQVCRVAASVGAWILHASSREVYGRQSAIVTEDTEPAPVNTYGITKAEAEQVVCASSVATSVLRLSNVYGGAQDHADRVIPAFVEAAMTGGVLRVDDPGATFDFVHVDDAIDGVVRAVGSLDSGTPLPPIHLTTGTGTTLDQLADMCIAQCGGRARKSTGSPRDFDVSWFVGDNSRARELLDWSPKVNIVAGISRMLATT